MRALVMQAAEKGYPVRIHTIGDAAIHEALNIFEDARAQFGPLPEGRHNCLEHLENFLPGDVERLAELDVIAAVQPPHMTLDPGGPERDLGDERVKLMWPFRTMLDEGETLAFGTDSPVVDVNSMGVLYSAATRRDPQTRAPEGGWRPEQLISRAEAIRAYTAGSDAAAQRNGEAGVLAAASWRTWRCSIPTCLHAPTTRSWMRPSPPPDGRTLRVRGLDRPKKRPKMASEPPSVSTFPRNRRGLGKPLGALCIHNVSAPESKGRGRRRRRLL